MEPEPSVPTPTDSSAPESAAAASRASGGSVPASVLILGFVVVVLLGVLVAVSLRPKDGKASTEEDPAIRDLKGRLQAQQESVNQERLKLGLSPLYTGAGQESAEAVAKRITEDAATLVGLSKGGMNLIADKEAERAQTAKELTDALQLQSLLREKNLALQDERDRALLEASTANAARKDLEKANTTIGLLQKQIERLEKGGGDIVPVIAERDRLRAQVAELQSRLSKTSLFAGTEAQMFKEAVELFRDLRQLEGKTDQEIMQAYSQYGLKYGAMVFPRKLAFPTGSSELAPEDVDLLRSLPTEASDNAYIVVIGYASETGNVDDNRVLSSDRATAVAQVLDAAKKPGQQVQAAYLGQTDRFGSRDPVRNQICEVWQITPKAAPRSTPPPPQPGE